MKNFLNWWSIGFYADLVVREKQLCTEKDRDDLSRPPTTNDRKDLFSYVFESEAPQPVERAICKPPPGLESSSAVSKNEAVYPDLHETKITQTVKNLSRDFAVILGDSDNQIDLEKILEGQDTRTTFMIRNIPNKVWTW